MGGFLNSLQGWHGQKGDATNAARPEEASDGHIEAGVCVPEASGCCGDWGKAEQGGSMTSSMEQGEGWIHQLGRGQLFLWDRKRWWQNPQSGLVPPSPRVFFVKDIIAVMLLQLLASFSSCCWRCLRRRTFTANPCLSSPKFCGIHIQAKHSLTNSGCWMQVWLMVKQIINKQIQGKS